MSVTNIEWTATVHADGSVTPGRVWNPVTGCTKVSQGCKHCYAETVAGRFWGTQYRPVLTSDPLRTIDTIPTSAHDDYLAHGMARPRRFTDVWTHEDRLLEPLRWRKPCRVFVNSMSDLFHKDVPDEFIHRVFAVMALAKRHTFLVLTKRPERMFRYFDTSVTRHIIAAAAKDLPGGKADGWQAKCDHAICNGQWPLPNVWLGVSVEDQATADARIPLLLQTPAAIRFVSYEPALGPVDLSWMLRKGWCPEHDFDGGGCSGPCKTRRERGHRLGWVIVGGESGRGARPFDVAWARSTVSQCREAGVPVFVKQLGAAPVVPAGRLRHWEWGGQIRSDREARFVDCQSTVLGPLTWRVVLDDRKGGDPAEWPEDLRAREWPR